MNGRIAKYAFSLKAAAGYLIVNENARVHMKRLSSYDINVVPMLLPSWSNFNPSLIGSSNPVLSQLIAFSSISAPKQGSWSKQLISPLSAVKQSAIKLVIFTAFTSAKYQHIHWKLHCTSRSLYFFTSLRTKIGIILSELSTHKRQYNENEHI